MTVQRRGRIGGLRFDSMVAAASAWLVGGLYIDGWAHNHIGEDLDPFFTPWHGAFYSGFLATAALILAALVGNHARGCPWRRAMPPGYALSLLGVAIFGAGGAGDMVWHLLFGVEDAKVEAWLSPTHLLLALGLVLIVSGPLRAGWRRPHARMQRWAAQLPMLVSLSLVLSVFTFFTQYAHPTARPWAAEGNRPTWGTFNVVSPDPALTLVEGGISTVDTAQVLGITGVLLQTGLLIGLLLLLVSRWWGRLAPGGLTLVLALNGAVMAVMRDEPALIPSAALAGVTADVLLAWLRPSPARPAALQLFASAVPVVLYALHFLTLALTGGIWWPVHVWAGTIALAGACGWLLSHAFLAPSATGLLSEREATVEALSGLGRIDDRKAASGSPRSSRHRE